LPNADQQILVDGSEVDFPGLRRQGRSAAILCLLILVIWFIAHTYTAAYAGLTGDDVMNIWQHALREPWPQSLLRILNLAAPLADGVVARGAGALFYRPLYEVFGFTPGPFHVALLAL
jgi:hypothetical protein